MMKEALLSPPGKFRNTASNQAITASFHTPYNPLIRSLINLPFDDIKAWARNRIIKETTNRKQTVTNEEWTRKLGHNYSSRSLSCIRILTQKRFYICVEKKCILVLRHAWTTNVSVANYLRRTATFSSARLRLGAAHLKKPDRHCAQIFLHEQIGRETFQQPDRHCAQIFLHKQIGRGTFQQPENTVRKYSSTSRLGEEHFNNQKTPCANILPQADWETNISTTRKHRAQIFFHKHIPGSTELPYRQRTSRFK